MERIAVIAKLKPGAEERAARLLESGPPFDPAGLGFARHSVFLSGSQAVFVFEGGKLDQTLRALVRAPQNLSAFGTWEPLVEGFPTVAREAYRWPHDDGGSPED